MSLCVGTLEPPKVIITLTMSRVVIMGRLLVGFAVGTITGVAPVFGAEIAKVCKKLSTSVIGRVTDIVLDGRRTSAQKLLQQIK